MTPELPELCGIDGCRRVAGHDGKHVIYPSEAWGFFKERDKKKIGKAGFATPRGGAKGAYQNHVVRSSRVIIPFERLGDVDLALYRDGYSVRMLPEQYFAAPQMPKPQFVTEDAQITVGENAFVLYRTHESFERLPPMEGWEIRGLVKNGLPVTNRGAGVDDVGHYVLRLAPLGQKTKRFEGPPQGVFAPEYADEETNFLSKCVLSWLTIQTMGSPYTLAQAGHLRSILRAHELDNLDTYERSGVLRRGLTCCPLCLRFLSYEELHSMVSFEEEVGLTNAGEQVEGATRSTVVNLFHLMPLLYHELTHIPSNIGWGHAVCNTRLGQRPCYSLEHLRGMNLKVGIVLDEGHVETFGWISEDWLMIRSANGAVWIQLNGNIAEGPPAESPLFEDTVDTNEHDPSVEDTE